MRLEPADVAMPTSSATSVGKTGKPDREKSLAIKAASPNTFEVTTDAPVLEDNSKERSLMSVSRFFPSVRAVLRTKKGDLPTMVWLKSSTWRAEETVTPSLLAICSSTAAAVRVAALASDVDEVQPANTDLPVCGMVAATAPPPGGSERSGETEAQATTERPAFLQP